MDSFKRQTNVKSTFLWWCLQLCFGLVLTFFTGKYAFIESEVIGTEYWQCWASTDPTNDYASQVKVDESFVIVSEQFSTLLKWAFISSLIMTLTAIAAFFGTN